jgi:hypothetical protein
MVPTSFIVFDNGMLSIGTINSSLWNFLSSICYQLHFLVSISIQYVAIFIVNVRCKRMRLDIGALQCKSYMGIYSPSMCSQLLNNSIELWCVLCVHFFFQFTLKFDCLECVLKSRFNFWCMYIYFSDQLLVHIHIQSIVFNYPFLQQ